MDLKGNDVDIWVVSPKNNQFSAREVTEVLSPDEKQRADRYHFAKDRERYAVTRGALRRIIAGYLNTSPDKIRLSYNHFGKPSLQFNYPPIRFNVSYSRDVALVAVAFGHEVGVDIEFVDRELDFMTAARAIFSPSETATLRKLPPGIQRRAFYLGWTRKEAYLKALGCGLSNDPRNLPFSALNNEHDISFRTSAGRFTRVWCLTSLTLHPDYAATLAVEGELGTIRHLSFSKPVTGRFSQDNVSRY